MTWPESNEKLRELKRKWESERHSLDTISMYFIERTIKEAEESLVATYKERSTDGMFGWKGPQTSNNEISEELSRQRDMDWKFGYKTCHICNKSARNDPCDICYRMVRDAAEWADEQCTMKIHPCAMCDDEVRSTICGTCMDIMLGGE